MLSLIALRVQASELGSVRLLNMRPAINNPSPRTFGVRESFVAFVLICLILVLCVVAIDLGGEGPVAAWLTEVVVNRPVESRYGFTAGWIAVGKSQRLVIASVARNGRFAQAGIAPGFAFPFATCGNFVMSGGWFRLLAEQPSAITLETRPGDETSRRVFRLRNSAP